MGDRVAPKHHRFAMNSIQKHDFHLNPENTKGKGKRDTILIKCNKNACKRIAEKVKKNQIKCKNTCHKSPNRTFACPQATKLDSNAKLNATHRQIRVACQ